MFDYAAEVRALTPIPGTHSHQCLGCQTVWSHGDHMNGDCVAHVCPECGRRQWVRTTEGYWGSYLSRTEP